MMENMDLQIELAKVTQRMDNTDRRIDNLEQTIKRIESLTISVEKLAISVENMAKEHVDYRARQNDLAKRLLVVEQQPYKNKAEKAEKIAMKVLELLIAGLVGFLLSYFLGI